MSTDPGRQSSLSRRRRQAATEVSVPEPAELGPVRLRWQSIATLAVLLALLVAAGIGIGGALHSKPAAAFTNCRTANQLSPRLFAAPPPMCISTDKIYQARIVTTRGDLVVIMPAREAPVTINNFVVLALDGYYKGLAFFRNETWVTQAGDPLGSGRGGPGYVLPEEPNSGPWTTGAVGMARVPNGPVNGSQFFILKSDWPGGGPGATVFNHFGTVLQGQELLKGMADSDRILGITITVQ